MFIGLGNPGKTFAFTRHNVGFQVIEIIASRLDIRLRKPLFHNYLAGRGECHGHRFLLAKPLTFMNNTGKALRGILKAGKCGIEDGVVVCDTLDLPPGVCRLKRKGSSAGHRGLSSIIDCSGTTDFPRLYIGIGRPENKQSVRDYVLGAPSGAQRDLLERATNRAAEALLSLLAKPFEIVSNELNNGHARA